MMDFMPMPNPGSGDCFLNGPYFYYSPKERGDQPPEVFVVGTVEVLQPNGNWEMLQTMPGFFTKNIYRFPPFGHNGGPSLDETEDPVVNPKELAGSKKPATFSVMPRWPLLEVGRVMSVGAAKYGAFNYRDSSISASVYQDAIERHLQLWFDGVDDDDETGVSHLASVIASCLLLMDAQATGKLNDDRQKTGIVESKLEELQDLLKSKPLPAPN